MSGASAALTTRTDSAAKLRARTSPKRGEMLEIPARTFESGSTPGDEGRDPTVEPALVPVALTPFSVDALPYPNDPDLPPRTGVSLREAQRLCSDRGARLCTELEWELACKGSELDLYATGDGWDTACDREPATCSSGYGVRGMGVLREWTSSQIVSRTEGALALPAVRGAGAPSPDAGPPTQGVHGCARRTRASESRAAHDLGFRCCRGTPNAAEIAPIAHVPGFRPTKMDAGQIAKIFASIPELAALKDVRIFDKEHIEPLRERASAGISLTTQPLLWSPEAGAVALVLTGRTKSMSFIAALYPLEGEKYRLASYFLMLGDVAPIALAYEPHRRQDLLWSTCWGCAGEQGSVRVRDDHRIVIVQH